MASDVIKISTKIVWARAALVAAIAIAVAFGWISVRRQLGSLIGEGTSASDPVAVQMLPYAKAYAPGDPLVLWLEAAIEKQNFSPDSMQRAVAMSENTVRSSPYDFRWWLELGRSYEQADRMDRAEAAFKHAIELAPSYTFPRWQIGNFYIRRGRIDEALPELKLATVNNLSYREQVFALMWDYFDHDTSKVEAVASDGVDVMTTLAMFYSKRGQAADALRIWNRIPPEAKNDYPQISSAVTQGLYEKRFFTEALEFSRSLGIDPDSVPEAVTNGGFEKPLASSSEVTYFGWKFAKGEGKLDAQSDGSVKHTGGRSLRVTFRNYTKSDLFTAGQNVVVKPGATYALTFWLRTEGLKSAGGPQIEIVNAIDDKILAVSRTFPQGTNDWQPLTIEFTAPDKCTSIVIRTTRAFCGENCPIVGTLWYDDFQLERK